MLLRPLRGQTQMLALDFRMADQQLYRLAPLEQLAIVV
jgi:hypothetical protein